MVAQIRIKLHTLLFQTNTIANLMGRYTHDLDYNLILHLECKYTLNHNALNMMSNLMFLLFLDKNICLILIFALFYFMNLFYYGSLILGILFYLRFGYSQENNCIWRILKIEYKFYFFNFILLILSFCVLHLFSIKRDYKKLPPTAANIPKITPMTKTKDDNIILGIASFLNVLLLSEILGSSLRFLL